MKTKSLPLLILLSISLIRVFAQTSPSLDVAGGVKVKGNNTIELGGGLTKEENAGKIGYATFTPQTLDIIGAGTTGTTRKMKFWNEGGATFQGQIGVGVPNPQEMLDVNGLVYTREGIKFPDQTIQTTALVSGGGGIESYPNVNAQPKPQPFALITATGSPTITDTLEIISYGEGFIAENTTNFTKGNFVVRINFERASQDILRRLTQGQAFTKFIIYMPEGDGTNYRSIELKTAALRKMQFSGNFIGNNAYANVIDLSVDFLQLQLRSVNPGSCFCWNFATNTTCACN